MEPLSMIKILILVAYTVIGVLDQISIQMGFYTPLFAATITGALMGDVTQGLSIGATLQLMTLGVATYGGATVPDYLTGGIIGTAYAILSGEGPEYGIGIAITVGLLLTQLDVFGRMTNVIFQHRADRCAAEGNVRGVETSNILGILPWTLSRVIPVFVGLYFGEAVVTAISKFLPDCIMLGLKAAGAILPAMGMAILMRYLPIKKYWSYFIIGFVLIAYSGGQFSVLAVALIGLALAGLHYAKITSTKVAVAGAAVADDEEVEIDD